MRAVLQVFAFGLAAVVAGCSDAPGEEAFGEALKSRMEQNMITEGMVDQVQVVDVKNVQEVGNGIYTGYITVKRGDRTKTSQMKIAKEPDGWGVVAD